MSVHAIDTGPEAEQVQLRLLRAARVAKRIALARSLTTTMQLAHRAIWQAHPADTPDEYAVPFVTQISSAELGAE